VVRLKGGDPALFGRGAEEAQELARAGISFEFVPGISSALAVPVCAGIPVTRRGLSSTVTIVTGHETPDKRMSVVRWGKLLDKNSTVVVLMGVASMKHITRKLKHPLMPAAVISNGSLSSQNIVTGTLANIAELAEKKGIRPPAVLVAGRVAGLRDELWKYMLKPFLPLSGKHIVVTRPEHASHELAAGLMEKGATVTTFPLIKIVPAPKKAVDTVIKRIFSYRWVVLTSANGADIFVEALKRNGIAGQQLQKIHIAAIGLKTAQSLERHGLKAAVVPETYVQEGLADAIIAASSSERGRVILLHSEDSRPALECLLKRAGFEVEETLLYRSVFTGNTKRLSALLKSSPPDMITITSSSCAKSLDLIMRGRTIKNFRKSIVLGAIGPVCAKTAKSLGFSVPAVAREYTSEGLVAVIEKYYGGEAK